MSQELIIYLASKITDLIYEDDGMEMTQAFRLLQNSEKDAMVGLKRTDKCADEGEFVFETLFEDVKKQCDKPLHRAQYFLEKEETKLKKRALDLLYQWDYSGSPDDVRKMGKVAVDLRADGEAQCLRGLKEFLKELDPRDSIGGDIRDCWPELADEA
jgi:hypothetical protein